MNYLDTLALWLSYVCLTLAAVRTVITSVMVTRASIIELHVALRTKITDAVALMVHLQTAKKSPQPKEPAP